MEYNLRKLVPSRKRIRVGDVFVLQMLDGLYNFGRVIRNDIEMFNSKVNLVYIFQPRAASKEMPDRDVLVPSNLLVPPLIVYRVLWSWGYFETIANLPIEEGESLERHCFKSIVRGYAEYFDEYDNPIAEPFEPVGTAGLTLLEGVEGRVSRALGFPVDPELL